ncbi:WD40/YVTN/BNR-like repeat-containing protein [Parapedobacter tibetensis]|uniref:WD40/YVTN/BNR-like repeat-containing protein n=1 Tax=Parapedobacter tibetensis TaxID=2972951 RepID=UPI00214D2160|nr:YCF48-related protein [Parapedobacter tibetensis]
MTIKSYLSLFLLLVSCGCYAQQVTLDMLQQGKPTSIRGLSVVDDSVAWVSGSDGWIAKTTDRGNSWDWQQVAGYEEIDFRDIEAFSAHEALIISAGSPLVILSTSDGGNTWQETHRDDRPEIFFDGMDFWDAGAGMAYGDPINGVMQLLATGDGGQTWQDISSKANIQLVEGEAGFAASGTGIRTLSGGRMFIGTGGARSRLFSSTDYGRTWSAHDCPIVQGAPSTGIFSIAFWNGKNGVVVGGDYLQDTARELSVFLTADGGLTWNPPMVGTFGFRSAVEYIGEKTLVAAGTSGVDVSLDGGKTWKMLANDSFHVVKKAKRGEWVVLAGAAGKIAELIMQP